MSRRGESSAKKPEKDRRTAQEPEKTEKRRAQRKNAQNSETNKNPHSVKAVRIKSFLNVSRRTNTTPCQGLRAG